MTPVSPDVEIDEALVPGAYNAVNVCLRVKPDEKVTVLTDEKTREIARSICREATNVGATCHLFVLEDFGLRPHVDMPRPILDDLASSQVSVYAAWGQQGELRTPMQMTQVVGEHRIRHSYTVASGGLTAARQGGMTGLSDMLSYRAGYTVSDRDFSPTDQGGSYWEEITASGDFGSQALGGDLTLKTITPFKSVFTDPTGDIFPSQGQLLVTGGEGTKLRLTATPTVQVQMEVSYDSDDEWEYSGVRTWDWFFQ